MPVIKVWVQFVWATKDRDPLLSDSIRTTVFQHILENGRKKGIFIDHVNGYVEHVHALISLGTEQTLSKVMQLIKGESSFWINKNQLAHTKFEWQDEYYAASVSEADVYRVRNYIKNQEAHHKKKTFEEEYDELVKFGFQRFG